MSNCFDDKTFDTKLVRENMKIYSRIFGYIK